ncbi:hypothetical protein GC173_16380 [bacterium]|nr:hypothetical protein [bacterium]
MSEPTIRDEKDGTVTLAPPLAAAFPVPTMEAWRAAVEKDLAGAPFDKKLIWQTPEGIAVNPVYTRKDLEGVAHLDSTPGQAPYVRGTEPLAGVLPKWQIRQDCLLASPEEVNGAIRDGLARGQTAIGIRLDNASRRGLDGDDPRAAEKAGVGGMTVSSINGVRIALQDIDMTLHPISWRTGSAALPVLAMHMALALERGYNPQLLTGSVECDPVRELVRTGHVRGGSLNLRFREMVEMVEWCARHASGMRPVVVNSNPWHNGGASAVQELAATIATGVEYIRRMVAAGLSVDAAALSMIFSFSVSENVFMEVAKLRAARLLWAQATEALGVKAEGGRKMFLHARTSTNTKSRFDPYNNMIRSAVEAFAAGVAGVDSLYIAPFDEVIGRPDDFSMRIARNQHLLLQEESHLSRIVDAAGGSYLIESLTDSLGRAAWEEFQKIEADGGIIESLRKGTIQAAIAKKADERRKAVASRRTPVVGVSNYANPMEKALVKSHTPRASFLAERRVRLVRLKSLRRGHELRAKLAELTETFKDRHTGRAFDIALVAAELGATIGEICAAIDAAAAPNDMIQVTPLPSMRLSEPFEILRDRTARWTEKNGRRPKVMLLPFGPLAMRRARADFSMSFFSAAGLQMEEVEPIAEAAKAVARVREVAPEVVVLCSDDDSYEAYGKELLAQLGASRPVVYVAGNPPSADALKAAGVDGFIHIRSVLLDELTGLLDRLAIS